jgi:methionine-rich copper-binding protein CopC
MKTQIRTIIVFVALSLFGIAGCTDSNAPIAPVAPTVVSTTPANGANKGLLRSPITITFTKAMDASTINASNFSVRQTTSGTSLAIVVTYDAPTHTASLMPPESIDAPTDYTVTVQSAVRDSIGLNMAANYQFTFSTGDGAAPTVLSKSPAAGATAVSVGTAIKVTFSEDMDSRFVLPSVGGFRLEQAGSLVTGTALYDSATRTATYTPAQPLAERTVYTAIVASWVRDLSGMPLGTQVSWTFTCTTADNTPPTAIISGPPRGNSDIEPNAIVQVVFSELMDPTSINSSTILLSNYWSGVAVPGTVTLDSTGSVATLRPTQPLTPGTAYLVTVTTGVKDLAGNPLRSNVTSNFATTPTPDTTRPEVTTTTPADGATGVVTSIAVRVQFSENVDGVSSSTFTLKKTATGEAVAGTVTYDGSFTEGTFTPALALTPNTSYTVTLTSGIQDFAGNSLLPTTFTFTTAP